jgi:hypothetical protein
MKKGFGFLGQLVQVVHLLGELEIGFYRICGCASNGRDDRRIQDKGLGLRKIKGFVHP